MSKYCPRCGKEHINNEEYCVDCHTKLPEDKIELNDKTPESIFRNVKNETEEKKHVKKDTGLGRIFTYEKTKNTPPKVEDTPQDEKIEKSNINEEKRDKASKKQRKADIPKQENKDTTPKKQNIINISKQENKKKTPTKEDKNKVPKQEKRTKTSKKDYKNTPPKEENKKKTPTKENKDTRSKKQNIINISKQESKKNISKGEDKQRTAKKENKKDEPEKNKTPHMGGPGKRKLIYGGIILLAIFILIIVAGTFTTHTSTNETPSTNYNFTDFVVSIPNNYNQTNDTDFLIEFSKDNVNVKFYTVSLSDNGYEGAPIEALQEGSINNIAYTQEGTVLYNELITLDNNYTAYNITYSAGGNVTRDIGFIKGNNEYDILFTTPENNEANLEKVVSEIMPTLKIPN